MEIVHDCVRDVLLYLEDHTGIYQEPDTKKYRKFEVSTRQLCEEKLLNNNSPDFIVYTVLKLREAGFLEGHDINAGTGAFYNIVVTDITWDGHELLGNIRDETAWNKTKEKAAKLGVSSIKGLATLAWQLFLASIQTQ